MGIYMYATYSGVPKGPDPAAWQLSHNLHFIER